MNINDTRPWLVDRESGEGKGKGKDEERKGKGGRERNKVSLGGGIMIKSCVSVPAGRLGS